MEIIIIIIKNNKYHENNKNHNNNKNQNTLLTIHESVTLNMGKTMFLKIVIKKLYSYLFIYFLNNNINKK